MIGIFLGNQNSGKTLSMTYFAEDYFKKGYKIYTNYSVNFPHEKLTKKFLLDVVKNKVQFNKAVFCIDEIYLIFDSRGFMKNRHITYFVLQTSKRDVHLFGTAQFFNTIELRLRDNTNFRVFCERVYKIENDNNITYLPIKNYDRFLQDSDNLYIKLNFINKTLIHGVIEDFDMTTAYLKAKPIFNLYDTTELLGLED